MQVTNPNKNNAISSIIQSLTLITNAFEDYEDSNLQKLDEVFFEYLTQRNLRKSKKTITASELNRTVDVLSLEGLNSLHEDSQSALLNLEKQMTDFYRQKSTIDENNSRTIAEFLQAKEGISIFELCKQLITQLSRFTDIQSYCYRLAECRGQSCEPLSADMMTQIEKYISEMEQYFRDDDSNSESQESFDVGVDEEFISKIRRNAKNEHVKALFDIIQ